MERLIFCCLILASLISQINSWPDGAPCIHAAFENMNPLEAVEVSFETYF
jgi:hypothetical protein